MIWRNLPPLSALRAFAAFAQTGSVVEAGNALNVSHAAISQQMRNLEDHLGLRLLDRSGRALALTAEGQVLAETLLEGFGRIGQTVSALTGADEDRPLTISTTPSFAAHWLMARIPGFRDKHPAIEIMINADARLTDPKPGQIDVCIRYGNGNWPGLECDMLMPTAIVAVAAPSLLAGHQPESPDELVDYPWLQEIGTSEASRWLAEQGVTNARISNILHAPGNLMLDGARSGQGVAVTARTWVEEDVRAGRLVCLFESPHGQGYHLVTAPGIARAPLRAFLAWVRREARNR
jgi:LysR family glycine cleavage system transcriptional activator